MIIHPPKKPPCSKSKLKDDQLNRSFFVHSYSNLLHLRQYIFSQSWGGFSRYHQSEVTWLTSWLQHGCRRLYHVLGRNIEHAEVFEPDAYRSNRCRIQAEGLGSMQGRCIELPKFRPCQKKEDGSKEPMQFEWLRESKQRDKETVGKGEKEYKSFRGK